MEPSTPPSALWESVDRALERWLAPADEALAESLAATVAAATRAGLPEIAVAPAQGRLLEILARAVSARRILEIGTLAGYSAIWLARALPDDGALVTLEIDPSRARLARGNLAHAGFAGRVEVIEGPALESLQALRARATPAFDFIFIDADKENCPGYLEHAVALARDGTLIVIDNAVRRGRVIDGATGDASVDGVRAMMDLIARHPRLAGAGVQTVGVKGYDGFVLALVSGAPEPDGATSDPLELLLRHDAWATREVLRACAGLSDAAWHRRFPMGPGSLHDTLTHVVGAMLRWADRIDGPPLSVRPSIEDGSRRSPAELEALLERAAADLAARAARARRRGLATELAVTLGGETHRFTLGAMLVHVTTHGTHHRAQCLNMLRQLGASSVRDVPGATDRLPEIDVLEHALRDARPASA